MTDKTFPALVKQYFGYLTDEYGFAMKEELASPEPFPFDYGRIEFVSSKTVMAVELDRAIISIIIGPAGEPSEVMLGLYQVVSFLTQGKMEGATRYNDFNGPPAVRIEYQLSKYAPVLQNYCDQVLRGDFSWWLDALKYSIQMWKKTYSVWSHGDVAPPHSYERVARYISEHKRGKKK